MTARVGWPNWYGVVCADLERQRGFYRDVLGLREIDAGEGHVWFDLGWPVLFELLALEPDRPQYDGGRFQVGFATGDIGATFDALRAAGAEIVTEPEGGPPSAGWWAYFRDAEGGLFEISQRLGPPFPRGPGGAPSAIVGPPVWIGVVADDRVRQEAFVRDVLGFRPLARAEGWTWFDGGWPHLLEVLERRDDAPQYGARRWQVAFAVGNAEEARDELVRRGAEPFGDIGGGLGSAGWGAYFRDAEGNFFAITQRLGPPWPRREDALVPEIAARPGQGEGGGP